MFVKRHESLTLNLFGTDFFKVKISAFLFTVLNVFLLLLLMFKLNGKNQKAATVWNYLFKLQFIFLEGFRKLTEPLKIMANY